jgi:hypothetical protein
MIPHVTRNTAGVKLDPFRENYPEREIAKFRPVPFDNYGVRVTMERPQGRLDDYLSVNFRPGNGPEMPVCTVDGRLVMSLTWMEAQSFWLPIQRARGVVGTSGLGLGYFPIRAAQKPEVSKVVVFERHRGVIKYFREAFAGRPELDKIAIVPGGALTRCKGYTFDYFLADHYLELLPDAAVSDITVLTGANVIKEYQFWGWERVLYEALTLRIRPRVRSWEGDYFARFFRSEYSTLARSFSVDRGFVEDAILAMGRGMDSPEPPAEIPDATDGDLDGMFDRICE